MDNSLVTVVTVVTLGMGLAGLHGGLGLDLGWLILSLPVAVALGAAWLLLMGWLTGALLCRQGSWWPRRPPSLGAGGGLPDLGWHLRDLVDFLNANWTLAALVVGGCCLTLPLAPFCFLAWWRWVCRAG